MANEIKVRYYDGVGGSLINTPDGTLVNRGASLPSTGASLAAGAHTLYASFEDVAAGYSESPRVSAGSITLSAGGSGVALDTTAHPTGQSIVASQEAATTTAVTVAAFGGGAGRWVTARVSWASLLSQVGTPTLAWAGTAPSGNTGWSKVAETTFASGTYVGYVITQIWRCWCPNSFSGAQVTSTRGSGSDASTALLAVDVWSGAASSQTAAATATLTGPDSEDRTVAIPITKTAASHLIAIAADASRTVTVRLTPNANTTADAGYFVDQPDVGNMDTCHLTSDAASGSQTVGYTEVHAYSLGLALEILAA